MSDLPNPGSPEAVEKGCTCPIIDNHHGEGFPCDGKQAFWIDATCPLHGIYPEGGESHN